MAQVEKREEPLEFMNMVLKKRCRAGKVLDLLGKAHKVANLGKAADSGRSRKS